VILRGPSNRVQGFADAVIAQPGVYHGNLSILPVSASEEAHRHKGAADDDDTGHRHLHLEPVA
jgi:hypothetical protein